MRRKKWIWFRRKWDLQLHNPSLQSEVVEVELPLRRSTIRIREGSTHHGLTVGRSIDIVLAGQAVDIEMKIHNSVHCAGGEGCSWPVCLEYTRGDHFLITVDILFDVARWGGSCQSFPGKWQDAERWALKFHRADDALTEDMSYTAWTCVQDLRGQGACTQRWVADSLT